MLLLHLCKHFKSRVGKRCVREGCAGLLEEFVLKQLLPPPHALVSQVRSFGTRPRALGSLALLQVLALAFQPLRAATLRVNLGPF